jgi:hypothetical protein
MNAHIQLLEKYKENVHQLYIDENGDKHLIFARLANICDINDEIIYICHLTLKQQKLYKKPFIMTSIQIKQLEKEDMTEENRKQIKLYKAIKTKIINENDLRKCMLIYHTLLVDDNLNNGECANCVSIKIYPSSYTNWKHI